MLLNHKRVRRERKGFSCGSLTVVNFFVVYFTFLLVQLPASGFLQFLSFCVHTQEQTFSSEELKFRSYLLRS